MLFNIPKLVRKYIHKLLVHEAQKFDHDISQVDIVIRNYEGQDHLWVYSSRDIKWLRELSDEEIQRILTE